MTRYTKECREQAILLSDEIGVKKAAELIDCGAALAKMKAFAAASNQQ